MHDPYDEDSSAYEEEVEKSIRHVPLCKYYEQRYGKSMQGNDQKGARVFKEYESEEKLRQFKNELTWIKDEKVNEKVLGEIIGKKKAIRRGSYKRWAELMLLWLAKRY